MPPLTQKTKDLWKEYKTRIISLIFLIVLIIPGIVMPSLIQPAAPQIVGTLDFNIPFQDKLQTPNVAEYVPETINQDVIPTIKTSPKFELPNIDQFVQEKKLEAKKDIDLLREKIIPVKSSGKISWESGIQKGIVSDKFMIGTLLRISNGDKSVFRKVESKRVTNTEIKAIVDRAVFEELGLNPDQTSEADVAIEQV